MKIKVDINGLGQLSQFAEAFAKTLKEPKIILLKGDLGSGKTTFVKEVVKFLGCNTPVTSPTFTLLNISAEEAEGVGFAEYFDKNTLDGIVFVEWPENVEGLIKKADFVVSITKLSPNARRIIVEGE